MQSEPVDPAFEMSKTRLGPFLLAASPVQLLQLGVVTLDALPGGALGSPQVTDVHEPMPGGAKNRLALGPGDL